MNIIINGFGGQHDLDVSSSFIQGYESVGGNWTGSILMSIASINTILPYAKSNGYSMVIRSTTLMENYIPYASSSYPDVLTVMPAGSNTYELIYIGSIPQVIMITGAGDVNNETGYHIEFFSPDPIQIEPDASSYSNGYIAGQIAYIMDTLPCNSWEARYRAQQTATAGTSGSSFDGYGKINITEAINYTGSIISDPFITGSGTGSGNIPLGGFTMQYLTPVTISSSLNVKGTTTIGTTNIDGKLTVSRLSGVGNALSVRKSGSGGTAFSFINEGTSHAMNINHTAESINALALLVTTLTGSLVIDKRAWLGIGPLYPSYSLDVYGDANITGSLIVSGAITASNLLVTNTITASNISVDTITADTFIVNTFTSSSTDVVSGSTKFGSVITDTHQFTGSVYISGSEYISGSLTLNGLIADISNARNITLRATNQVGSPNIYLKAYVENSYWGNGIKIYRARGTQASPAALQFYDTIGDYGFLSPYPPTPNTGILTAKISSNYTSSDSDSFFGSDLRFFTSNDADGVGLVERMVIEANGNVAIGTTTEANSLLSVQGTTKFGNNTLHTHQFTGSVYIAGDTFFTAGNVGIGKVSPSVTLDVYGNTNISGSLNVSGSIIISGSLEIAGTPSASLIMNSEDGSRWHIWILNDGTFSSSKIT